jgi:hypothetical protein
VVENSVHYLLDAQGRFTVTTTDEGSDGTIDRRETRVYSDPILDSATYSLDEGDDGTIEFVEVYAYDADDNLTYLADDSSPDGVFDYEVTQTWAGPGQLLAQTYVDHTGGALASDYVYTITYDAQDRIVDISYIETRHTSGAVVYEDLEEWTFGGTCP